jgi:hypothetical protein
MNNLMLLCLAPGVGSGGAGGIAPVSDPPPVAPPPAAAAGQKEELQLWRCKTQELLASLAAEMETVQDCEVLRFVHDRALDCVLVARGETALPGSQLGSHLGSQSGSHPAGSQIGSRLESQPAAGPKEVGSHVITSSNDFSSPVGSASSFLRGKRRGGVPASAAAAAAASLSMGGFVDSLSPSFDVVVESADFSEPVSHSALFHS